MKEDEQFRLTPNERLSLLGAIVRHLQKVTAAENPFSILTDYRALSCGRAPAAV